MSTPHQFSLRWNNYLRHITVAFDSLRSQEDLVDVTLSCEGRKIRAHKILLSACSSYFRDIFKENPCQHPVIIFKNVKYEDLTAIIEFMYQGEVNVVQESLPSFLHTAELLCVQGLTENKEFIPAPMCETIQIPKLTKIVPMTATTTQSTTQIPLTTLNAHINFTSSNQQTQEFIEIQQPIPKKQKLALTENIKQQTQHQQNIESEELEFIPHSLKIELPEYINMETSTVQQQITHHDQNNQHIAGTDVQIQTDEDGMQHSEIVHEGEEEDDQKNYMQNESYEIIHEEDDGDGGGDDAIKEDMNKEKDSKQEVDQEMGSVEMNRLFVQQQGSGDASSKDGELKFRCSICWKGFKHPNSLTLHKALHNGKTKCPVCYRAFSRSYDMKTHMTKIHKITLSVETKLNLTN